MLAPVLRSVARCDADTAPSAFSIDTTHLSRLRKAASKARVAASMDLFEACTLVAPPSTKALDVYLAALFRTLPQALGRRLTMHPVQCQEISFDEAWLLQVINRFEANDLDSVSFLLKRRIPHVYNRPLVFLLRGVCDNLIAKTTAA